jgi:hypothetical protein
VKSDSFFSGPSVPSGLCSVFAYYSTTQSNSSMYNCAPSPSSLPLPTGALAGLLPTSALMGGGGATVTCLAWLAGGRGGGAGGSACSGMLVVNGVVTPGW